MADEMDEENFVRSEDDSLLTEHIKHSRGNKIDLSNKGINSIPKALYQLKHLQYLYLERNSLENLPTCFAETLCQLTWLDLRHNKLQKLPENISNLKHLKNLLLEDNCLHSLPLQLGLMVHLTGLNLAKNPLEFPPKDIIESGTKGILAYLRDYVAIEEKFSGMDIKETPPHLSNDQSSPQRSENEELNDSDYENISEIFQNGCGRRRFSLEEQMLNSPPYQIHPLQINERKKLLKKYVPPLRKRELSSAPVRKHNDPLRQVRRNSEVVDGYHRYESFEVRYQRELESSERRKFNEKADVIIQKQKNKQMLDEWRRKNRQQRTTTKRIKHEIYIPYGNELQKATATTNMHAKKVQENLRSDNKINFLRKLRDQQLDERIQEHVRNLRDWKRNTSNLTVEDELKTTKSNLQKALQLQKDFEEKRALEYRLRAFTAEDYAPPAKTFQK